MTPEAEMEMRNSLLKAVENCAAKNKSFDTLSVFSILSDFAAATILSLYAESSEKENDLAMIAAVKIFTQSLKNCRDEMRRLGAEETVAKRLSEIALKGNQSS